MTNDDISARLEALKLVREWSAGLVVIESGAIAVLGALLKEPPTGGYLVLVVALLISMITSIWFGAVSVAGTIPFVVQNLPKNPVCDIYKQRGGIGKLCLGHQCMLQEHLFVLSLVLFAVVLVIRPSTEATSLVPKQSVAVQAPESSTFHLAAPKTEQK